MLSKSGKVCKGCSNCYFCRMFCLEAYDKKCRAHLMLGYILLSIFLVSCDSYFKKTEDVSPLARVGENYLYPKDVAIYLTDGMSKSDSASFVTNHITTWASKQLLLSKAKINLQEDKLRTFDALVADYRTDLYTRAYKEALVAQGLDSLVSQEQLVQFYEEEKENFKLKERIVRMRFVSLPKNFLNKEEVGQRLKNFKKEDVSYLDSIGVQFKKLHFNDSIWVRASRVVAEIPPISFENEDRYLKKSQFFELEDSIGVYLGKVEEVKDINEIAPLSFIVPTIKQVLLNRRKIDYLRKLETEIIDEAIKDKEFEVYDNNK